MGAIVVLGMVLIFFSSQGDQAEAESPLVGEHWHAAVGISVCGEFQPDLTDVRGDPSGIHSHGDGLIHMHPKSTRYTGDGANLGVWATEVGLVLEDEVLQLPGGDRLENGDDCGGEPGVVQVKVWEGLADEQGRLLESDFADHSPGNGSLVTVAFAPEGADLAKPPSAGTVPSDVAPPAGVPVPQPAPTDTPTPGGVPADPGTADPSAPGEAPAPSTPGDTSPPEGEPAAPDPGDTSGVSVPPETGATSGPTGGT
ncbi:MAG: hypothetical protein ACR2K0_02920 [Acidimicrobiales bacterium]|jgi:hypothetical protein